MSNPNYITQGSNGMISIDFSSVPDKGFLDVVKTKDIIKFSIMSYKDKKDNKNYTPGGPDITAKHITGEVQLLDRRELVSSFVHASGNKIKLSILKSNTPYLAYNTCNEKYKAMKLPDNCVATLPNGVNAKPGSYIVTKVNENGQIDRDSFIMISSNIFKKIFKIPMQTVLKKHIGNESKTGKILNILNRNRNKQMNFNTEKLQSNKTRFDSSEIGMNPVNINIGSINDSPEKVISKPNISGQLNANKQTASTNNKSTYKYRVTAKLVDMNGKMLGFVVQEIATGRTRNLKINELTQLCMNKLVENVMVVRNMRGNMYIKGNGCRLEHLPQVIA